MMSVPVGSISLTTTAPPLALVVKMDATTPVLAGGDTAYAVTPRPGRPGITTFEGREPYRLIVGLMLDGWRTNENVAGVLRALRRMHAAPTDDRRSEPPAVRVEGPGLPQLPDRMASEVEWRLAVLTPGEALHDTAGRLLRQQVTIELLEWIPDELLVEQNVRPGATPVRYRVKRGDTLRGVALKHLRKPVSKAMLARKINAIKKRNGIRDQRHFAQKFMNKVILIP